MGTCAGQTPAAIAGEPDAAERRRLVDELRFGIEKSMRYHRRRQAFYESCRRTLMLGVILGGSAGIAQYAPIWAGLAVTVLAALDLVWDIGVRAREHRFLHWRYAMLLAEIPAGMDAEAGAVERWRRQRLEIEAEEPPIYWALEADCYNEVCRALARDHGVLQIAHRKRLLMHLWRFEQSHFAPQAAG